jgi:hypothetical protein
MNRLRATATFLFISLFTISSANAASILFGRVSSGAYVADGQDIVNYLLADGNTVDYVDLNTMVISDFSAYSQVWIYDLVVGPNQSSNQLANYTNIANWYNNDAAQNLITDGRIISSSERWTNRGNGLGTGGEPEWIQNYATQLDSSGGGLVLGTDHNVYQGGINSINSLIGINDFTGYYYSSPLEAFVDPLSPLFTPELEECSTNTDLNCINDNSSTGFVPTGLQPNGQYLTPVAYHGLISTAYENAAVSSTFGSPTFPDPDPTPTPVSTPEPSTLLLIMTGILGIRLMIRNKGTV